MFGNFRAMNANNISELVESLGNLRKEKVNRMTTLMVDSLTFTLSFNYTADQEMTQVTKMSFINLTRAH